MNTRFRDRTKILFANIDRIDSYEVRTIMNAMLHLIDDVYTEMRETAGAGDARKIQDSEGR